MLIRLFGSNFRSLKEEFELSMVAAALTRDADRDRGVIDVDIVGMAEPLRLLRSVAIYGPNASGKSTVFTAARALRWLAIESSSQAEPDGSIPPYEPFLLDAKTTSAPIELGCDLAYEGSILRYELAYNNKEIVRETLSILGEREDTLINRQGSEVRGSLFIRGGVNRLYVRGMQPNVTVLSKLAQHGPHRGRESVRPYYKVVSNALRCEDYSDSTGLQIRIGELGDEKFADDPEYREWIMNHLMRPADVGICDVETRRETFEVPDEIRERVEKLSGRFKLPETRVVVSFIHEGKVVRPIDFSHESAGTRKLFNIADEWWALAKKPVTLFADELSASLHPRLLDRVIRAVNEPASHKAKSQLVFTTHDTGLLEGYDGQPAALRRDQVYFTKKNPSGATELYSLTEFKEDARPVHNIRKRYLSGLFGAIPSAEKLSL